MSNRTGAYKVGKGRNVGKYGAQPLSRMHPDHPARKEFEGRQDRPNLEAPPGQRFAGAWSMTSTLRERLGR